MIKHLPLIEKVLLFQFLLTSLLLIGFDLASIWFVLSSMLLASFYMMATILLVNTLLGKKAKDGFEVVILLASQISLAMSVVSVFFKVMSFPGAAVFLVVSAISLLFISILITIKQVPFYSILLKRTMFFGLLSGILFWMPISNWIHYRYHNHPKYADVYINYLENPRDSTAKANWEKELENYHRAD
jgi:hypothetical protein